jgi:serine/threonine protein kinase
MLAANQVIDRYTVIDLLGEGGMAMVFRVRHNQLDTEHALKVLTITKTGIRERLIQEGRVQAKIRHENVVSVTDVLDIGGAPGLLMEYIEGPALEEWLTRYRPSLFECEAVLRGIAAGVNTAHEKGLIHRDLKPGNVMMARKGDLLIPKVTDFGLAKAVSEEFDAGCRTRTGVAMGTPAYMAPEQVRDAGSVDKKADVFALGAILYEMVCGKLAFDGSDLYSIFEAASSGDFEPPETLVPGLPKRIRRTIIGALNPDPNKRIPDCNTLLSVLSGERRWRPDIPAEATWSGSIDDFEHDPLPTEDTGEVSFWPPETGISFSDEAISAAEAPIPRELPTMQQLTSATYGVSMLVSDTMLPIAEPVPTSITVRLPWQIYAGFGGLAMLVLLVLVVLMRIPIVREMAIQYVPEAIQPALGIAEAEPEPEPTPVAPGTGHKATKADEPKTEIIVDMGPKYMVTDPSLLPDDVELTLAPEAGEGTEGEATAEGQKAETPAKKVEANLTMVENPEDLPDDGSINIAAMSKEEIAALPEDKLPPGMGYVDLAGAHKAWLISNLGQVEPGLVAAGTYQIKAQFEEGGKVVGAGEIYVPVGRKVTVLCDPMFQVCTK